MARPKQTSKHAMPNAPLKVLVKSKAAQKALKLAVKGGVLTTPEGADVNVVRPHRFRRGTVALRQVRKLQKSVNNLVPVKPMERMFREISEDIHPGMMYREEALKALHVATEAYLSDILERGLENSIHDNKLTVLPRHVEFERRHDPFQDEPCED